MVCFKGCLPQILLGPFLNTLSQKWLDSEYPQLVALYVSCMRHGACYTCSLHSRLKHEQNSFLIYTL